MIEMVEYEDFIFKDKFQDLTDVQFHHALQMINAQFTGVYKLWHTLPPAEAKAKRELCINYLVGWQLMELYPDSAIGVSGTGGMPIQSKKAGPVFIRYKDTVRQSGSGTLDLLSTNEFGLMALQLLQNAPEMYMTY